MARAALFVLLLLAVPQAARPAGFDNWLRIANDQLQGSPVCISWGENRIDCFIRGADHGLRHFWWGNAQGNLARDYGYQNLGGSIADDPGCATDRPNHIECMARGTDGGLWRIGWLGGGSGGPEGWTFWYRLDGTILDSPSCTSWGPGRIDCFARGGDRAMYQWTWDGRQWRGWSRLGGTLIDRPNCLSIAANRLHCFALGTDSAAYRFWWDGAAWHGWLPVGDTRRFSPTPSCFKGEYLTCMGLGSGATLFMTVTTSPGRPDERWQTWEAEAGPLTPSFASGPACWAGAGASGACMVLGDDGTMRAHRIPDPTNFGWSQSTGSMANPPGCVLVNLNVLLNSSSGRPYWNREARLTCFAVAPGNGFYWSNVAY